MDFNSSSPYPDGVISFLDTDLYKLTMQCAVYQYFRDVSVTYAFTNRTPDKKLSRTAYKWLDEQITSTSRRRIMPIGRGANQRLCRARQYFTPP